MIALFDVDWASRSQKVGIAIKCQIFCMCLLLSCFVKTICHPSVKVWSCCQNDQHTNKILHMWTIKYKLMLTPSTNSFYFFPKASLCVHESFLNMIEMYITMKFQYKPIVGIHLVSGSSI